MEISVREIGLRGDSRIVIQNEGSIAIGSKIFITIFGRNTWGSWKDILYVVNPRRQTIADLIFTDGSTLREMLPYRQSYKLWIDGVGTSHISI